MKVLHLTTHLNTGGITTYILRLAGPLKKRGVAISVLSSGGEYEEYFLEARVPVYKFPIKTKSELHPKIYLVLPQIAKLIKQEGIELLHAHTRVTQVMGYWLSKMTGIPLVTTCHGFYKRRLGRRILPAWGERAVAISELVGDQLRKDYRLPSARVKVINNGVNIEELDASFKRKDPIRAREHFGFRSDHIVIGVVSRLVRDKGHEYLIESISELKSELPMLRLLIVGEGRDKGLFQQTVEKFSLNEYVHFVGNLRDVTLALAAMDIFAFPAIWREGFGLSIIEAMTCRKPVIVSNIWALNTLIRNGETGILVEPKNVASLNEAIRNLLLDKDLYASLVKNARATVEEFFSVERMADEISELYFEFAAKKADSAESRVNVMP